MRELLRTPSEHGRVQVTFFMPRDLHSWLVEKAKSNGESLSSVIRGCIREEHAKERQPDDAGEESG